MRILSTLLLSACFIMPFNAQAAEFTAEQKVEIEKMFAEYLKENGDVVLESVNSYQARMVEEQQEEARLKAANFVDTLKDDKNLTAAGNPKGDVTIVEFFDYNCGYCTRAYNEVATLLEDDKNIRVVFMDMPILGPSSMEASKWSLAAHEQGKYWEYHQAIMDHEGPKEADTLEKLAKDLGLDVKKMKKDKESKEIADQLSKNIEVAQEMGIRGTPGFVIGNRVSPGYIPLDQMKKVIDEARNSDS